MDTKNASINLEDLSTCEENTQPIRSFRLFTGEFYYGITTLEYHWGLEKEEMDLWGPLNRIFVRADVAPLFLDWKLALVPTVEVLQKLSETVEHNFLMPTDQRRSCFEVLPPGEYEYDLIPVEKDPPTLFLIRNGSTSPQKLELAYPQYPHVKLNVHPAFAVVHGIYQQYPSVHGGRLYFRLMSLITAVCYSSIPREFRDARPSFQFLPRRSSGQDDDESSFESDDSESLLLDDRCSAEDEEIGIRSWLEAVPRSSPLESLVEQMSKKSEIDFITNACQN